MSIKETAFNGVRAIQLENEFLEVIVLPEFGSKVASMVDKETGFQLLYQPHNSVIKLPKVGGNFGDYDPFGYDDCYPTIDKDRHIYAGKALEYPDHGETWAGKFSYRIGEGKLMLDYSSELMAYSYHKEMKLDGRSLIVDFNIMNQGAAPIDGFYTFHGLLNMNTEVEIQLPKEVNQVVNVCDISALGNVGRVVDYPLAKTIDGQDLFLNKVMGPEALKCEKYYTHIPLSEGKCSVLYHKEGLRFDLEYDPMKLPYLGVWINEMGVLDHYNLALEPSNGYFDKISRAKSNGKYLELKSGECFEFALKLSLVDL